MIKINNNDEYFGEDGYGYGYGGGSHDSGGSDDNYYNNRLVNLPPSHI